MSMPRAHLSGRFAIYAAGLFCALVGASAQISQQPAQAQEVTTREVPLDFRTKVNLVTVPVIVRDAQSHAVGDLSREDFQLFDNGKPQTVSRFAVERFGDEQSSPGQPPAAAAAPTGQPASAPPAPPDRFIAYMFDDVNIGANELSQAREAAYRQIAASLRLTERAAIYTTSGEGGVDFTADREKLRRALMAIRQQNPVTDQHRCPPMTIYQAFAISKSDPLALGAAMADDRTCGSNPTPSDPNDTRVAQDLAVSGELRARNAARELLALADRNINTVLARLDGIVKKLSQMAGLRTVVLVSSGFLMLDERRQDESAVLERAVRAGVVVNALDARALWALAPGLDASSHTVDSDVGDLPAPGGYLSGQTAGNGGSSLVLKNQMARAEALANRDIMAEIAANTGGRFFENSNDLRGGFERLTAAPEYIYVLGFAPQDLKLDGKFHRLKVTLRNSKGFTLEARRGYYAPRYANDPAEQSKEEIEEAFFSRSETREIPVVMQMQFFKSGDYEATVSVAAKIDVRELPFKREADRNRDELTVVAGLFDADGNYVKGTQKVVDLRLRDETLAGRLEQGITVRHTFSVSPGTYFVRIVVRDSEGRNLTAHSGSVEVP